MQLQEKKINRLLKSKDAENQKLGKLALLSILDKDNVIYWYLTLDSLTDINTDDELHKTITKLLGWSSYRPAMECFGKIITYIQTNRPSPLSIEKFFAYYSEYLYSLMSSTWTTEERKSIKSQIPQLNVSTASTKSNEDL